MWRTVALGVEDKETIKIGLITREVIQWMTSVLMCLLIKITITVHKQTYNKEIVV